MWSFVLGRLDCCKSLVIDITSAQKYRLQKKKIWIMQPKSLHVTPRLKKPHRPPVKQRILFKIATFAFRFFDGTLPPYVSLCLSVYTPSRTLRSSSDEKTLSRAKWKLKGFGHRSFSVQAPLVWNSLPPNIGHSCSLSQFKSSLKTFLFTSAFSELPWFPRRFEIFFPPHRLLMFVCCWFVSESESGC